MFKFAKIVVMVMISCSQLTNDLAPGQAPLDPPDPQPSPGSPAPRLFFLLRLGAGVGRSPGFREGQGWILGRGSEAGIAVVPGLAQVDAR